MGCGKWENWVMLQRGAQFTWAARIAPNKHGGNSRPRGQREAKMCNQLWLDVTTSHAPPRKGGIMTTTPPPSWATAQKPATLPCSEETQA